MLRWLGLKHESMIAENVEAYERAIALERSRLSDLLGRLEEVQQMAAVCEAQGATQRARSLRQQEYRLGLRVRSAEERIERMQGILKRFRGDLLTPRYAWV